MLGIGASQVEHVKSLPGYQNPLNSLVTPELKPVRSSLPHAEYDFP